MSGRSRYVPALLLLVALGVLFALPVRAGGDDLAFARTLVEARHFDLARALCGRIAADASRTPEERDDARYAMALIPQAEALADPTEARVAAALEAVAAFLAEQPTSAHVAAARLERIRIPLAGSAWARENEREDVAARFADLALEAATRVAADAPLLLYRARLARARLRAEATAELGEIAALVEDVRETREGSPEERDAAQLLGEVLWELARRTEDATGLYGIAFACFVGGLEGSVREPGYVARVARAYRHLAELALEAAERLPEDEIQRTALEHLDKLPEQHPAVRRTQDGARAWIAWSRLLCHAGDVERAIGVARAAEAHASREARAPFRRVQIDCLQAHARALRSPDLLTRLGDLHFAFGDYRAAIDAYRRVILSSEATSGAFLAWRWHAWERMARAYGKLGDHLAEALAYEPIHEAWLRGWIPCDRQDAADPNLLRAGSDRRHGERALGHLADLTNSPVFRRHRRALRNGFLRDYPSRPILGSWNRAVHLWVEAQSMRRAGLAGWRAKVEEAYLRFVKLSEDPREQGQDAAWVYRIRAMWILDRLEDAVAEAEQARAWWASKAARDLAATHEPVRRRQAAAQAAAEFWTARALVDLDRSASAVPHLAGYAERHPTASEPYPLLARLLLIHAYAHLGDQVGAERALTDLRGAHPDWVPDGDPRVLADVLQGARMWEQARAVYAAYLAHPSVAAKPESDPGKRHARLQLAWVLLALDREAADQAVRAQYLGQARRTLETILTNDPADRALIDAMLANRIVVLKIFVSGAMERIPVPVCTSTDELRRRLHAIAERTEHAETRGILFRQARSKDEMLEHLLPPAGRSLFDPGLYVDRANIDPLFRLNLARVYARYANPDDEWRAWNLVQSLIHPPLAVAEDSDVWWQARALDGELRVRRAMRAVLSIWGGTSRYTPREPEGALDPAPFLREDR